MVLCTTLRLLLRTLTALFEMVVRWPVYLRALGVQLLWKAVLSKNRPRSMRLPPVVPTLVGLPLPSGHPNLNDRTMLTPFPKLLPRKVSIVPVRVSTTPRLYRKVLVRRVPMLLGKAFLTQAPEVLV